MLNPAEKTSAADIKTFDRNARALQPPSQNAFPWVRITVKMHALAHHIPVFLRRFGSLGVYGDQALVGAWHGFFNHFQAQLTTESFLGSCLKPEQRAVISCDPGVDAALDKRATSQVGQTQPAPPD